MALAALDQFVHGIEGRFTGGPSLLALGMATADWALHLLNAPFRRIELALHAALADRVCRALFGAQVVEPETNDHRFVDPAWENLPYSLFRAAADRLPPPSAWRLTSSASMAPSVAM